MNSGITIQQQKMLITSFVFNRVLIGQILLHPLDNISTQLSTGVVKNLKTIASVLYHITNDAVKEIIGNTKNEQDDGIEKFAYTKSEIIACLKEPWVKNMQNLFLEWLNKTYEMNQKCDKK